MDPQCDSIPKIRDEVYTNTVSQAVVVRQGPQGICIGEMVHLQQLSWVSAACEEVDRKYFPISKYSLAQWSWG